MGGGGEEETVNVDEETMGGDSSRGAHLASMKQSVMVVPHSHAIANYFPIDHPSFHYSSSSTLNSRVLSRCAPEKVTHPSTTPAQARLTLEFFQDVLRKSGRDDDYSRVNRWIWTALERGLSELQLHATPTLSRCLSIERSVHEQHTGEAHTLSVYDEHDDYYDCDNNCYFDDGRPEGISADITGLVAGISTLRPFTCLLSLLSDTAIPTVVETLKTNEPFARNP
ncbi:unnamed protein product [Brassica napus]|uniref:(rape) hypothetical protein n=1 Tax=Brassica napus TaxID=3708 RepID=A0A816U9A7_BRANA|nr:unnamed protein product [Brassica napus]